MKSLCFFVLVFSASSALAEMGCLDRRAAFFTPCPNGQTYKFVQGQCPKSYQVESFYCAEEGNPECLDVRAADFGPCPAGETRIYVQGQCEQTYQVEHTYCAVR